MLIACAVALATALVYSPALSGGFLLDDDLLLTNNPLIKDPAGCWRFWCTTQTPDYLPLMSDSFWLEWRLWGMNPAGYHVTNVLLHAGAAVLLGCLLRRLGIPGAWWAAAIFALHPVNVRSVAWIAERKNTLSMVFFLGALLTYFRSEDERSRRFYAASLFLFACALLSKSSTVVLPLVLLILAWYRRGRLSAADVCATAPFFACALAAALTTVWYQYHVEIRPSNISTEPFAWRLASAGYAVWFYLGKLIAPIDLAMIYPRIRIDAGSPLSYIPALLVAAALAVFFANRKSWGKVPLLVFGTFAACLLPVLGFVNMAFFKSSMVSDHLQYIAMIPIAAAAGAALSWAVARIQPSIAHAAFAAPIAVIGILAGLSCVQAGLYHDRLTLARDTMRTNPGSFWAHGEIAGNCAASGDMACAERELREVLTLDPRSVAGYNNLANLLIRQGRYAEASSLLVKAEQISPESMMVHMNLGLLYSRLGYVDEARQEFERALAIDPRSDIARNALAALPMGEGTAPLRKTW